MTDNVIFKDVLNALHCAIDTGNVKEAITVYRRGKECLQHGYLNAEEFHEFDVDFNKFLDSVG